MMKRMERFENQKGKNPTLAEAYARSMKHGLIRLNFFEAIWDVDLEPIADALDADDVQEFSISCRAAGLLDVLDFFQSRGFVPAGMVTVSAGAIHCPAVLLRREVAFGCSFD